MFDSADQEARELVAIGLFEGRGPAWLKRAKPFVGRRAAAWLRAYAEFFVRVETDGELWIEIQDRVRDVLNQQWDPFGVAEVVEDEYDGYIGEIYHLLKSGSSEAEIAGRLRSIEANKMDLRVSPVEKLHSVAESLRRLDLPDVRRGMVMRASDGFESIRRPSTDERKPSLRLPS